jgi:hypothetical protein
MLESVSAWAVWPMECEKSDTMTLALELSAYTEELLILQNYNLQLFLTQNVPPNIKY